MGGCVIIMKKCQSNVLYAVINNHSAIRYMYKLVSRFVNSILSWVCILYLVVSLTDDVCASFPRACFQSAGRSPSIRQTGRFSWLLQALYWVAVTHSHLMYDRASCVVSWPPSTIPYTLNPSLTIIEIFIVTASLFPHLLSNITLKRTCMYYHTIRTPYMVG